jgi:hypothetical protein
MTWTSLGTVAITASLDEVVVGTVDLPPTGGLEVRIKQISPAETSVFSAGRFFVKTQFGRVYGTKRFWGHLEGEDYQLGSDGFSSEDAQGELCIEPGRLNRRALKHPSLSPWILEVAVRKWQPAAGGGTGGGGGGTTPDPPQSVTFTPTDCSAGSLWRKAVGSISPPTAEQVIAAIAAEPHWTPTNPDPYKGTNEQMYILLNDSGQFLTFTYANASPTTQIVVLTNSLYSAGGAYAFSLSGDVTNPGTFSGSAGRDADRKDTFVALLSGTSGTLTITRATSGLMLRYVGPV